VGAKYYMPELREQKAQATFEKKLFTKTSKSLARIDGIISISILLPIPLAYCMGMGMVVWYVLTADVLLFEKWMILHKWNGDSLFYVLAPQNENELILLSILNTLEEVCLNLLR
jgi:hypothetical protein